MEECFEKTYAVGFRVYAVLGNGDVMRIYCNKSQEVLALVDGKVFLIDKERNTVLVFNSAEDFAMHVYRWLIEQLGKEAERLRWFVEVKKEHDSDEERDKLAHCERKLRLLREAKLLRLYVGIDKVFEVPLR